jgi:hypothetical protein
MRRLAILTFGLCALSACLLSIDESKIKASPDDSSQGPDSSSQIDDTYTPPGTVKDAEQSTVSPDGARTCSSGLTLCSDNVCYDTTGEQSHCGSCSNVCPSSQVCRASKCVPPGSCKELLARVPGTTTGVSDLYIQGQTLPVYCDMDTDNGGFTLVYRASAGQPGDPYTLFTGPEQNDDVRAEATPIASTKHYVSRLLSDWNVALPIKDVRVRLYNTVPGSKPLLDLVFDGTGSTKDTWFLPAKLKSSPWTDVASAEPTLFYAAGQAVEERRFFISMPYKGCDVDSGWLLVHGTNTTSKCTWENPVGTIRILYSAGTTAQGWNSSPPTAASFAIFVR